MLNNPDDLYYRLYFNTSDGTVWSRVYTDAGSFDDYHDVNVRNIIIVRSEYLGARDRYTVDDIFDVVAWEL